MAEQNKLSEIQGQLNQYGKMARGNPLEDGPFWRLERLMNFGTRIQDDIAGKLPTWDRGSLAKETLEVTDGQIGLSPTLKKAVKDLEQILKNYNKLPEKDQKEVYQDVYKAVEQLKKRYPQALDFQKQVPRIEVPALTDGIKGFHTLQDEIAQKPPGPSVKRPINDHGPLEAPPDVSKWFDRLNEGEGAPDHPTLTGKIRTPAKSRSSAGVKTVAAAQ